MSSLCLPREPLVAIIGTTGTGKSDLAVDLAVRFDGEVINADAMQMYKGLPIITNQISAKEQRGVPHHLLATIDHHEPTWTVGTFTREAGRLIKEIRTRGKLPIVVGGTHYYIDALLFEDKLVGPSFSESLAPQHHSQYETAAQFPILDEPTDVIMRRLREVDPTMAERWHPDDRRKIRRSLEIYLTTGKRASDIYAEQQRSKPGPENRNNNWESLVFWLYTEPEVLKARLEGRIDKMTENGLMDEVRDLHQSLCQRAEQGEDVDLTRGIWQSIGFKQMRPFLERETDCEAQATVKDFRESGLEQMRIATRQYARSQLRWVRHKSIPTMKEYDALRFLYLLDSSDPQKFTTSVLETATTVCRNFLNGAEMVEPAHLSDTAKKVLESFVSVPPKPIFRVQTCDVCNMSLATEDSWTRHINGRRHRRALKNQGKRAVVSFKPQVLQQMDG